MKKILSILIICAVFFVNSGASFAHVSISPSEVETESYQTFTVSAPTHGFVAVTEIRVVIPEGVINVTPTVKTGWDVTVVREGQHVMPDGTVMDDNAMEEGERAGHHSAEQVTELIWTGGIIPGEQRDEFSFSAKTPANETKLYWKAYQTFADGKVVSWELLPDEEYPKTEKGEEDVEYYGPASETDVVSVATTDESETEALVAKTNESSNTPLILSVMAIILAAGSIGMQFLKNKK